MCKSSKNPVLSKTFIFFYQLYFTHVWVWVCGCVGAGVCQKVCTGSNIISYRGIVSVALISVCVACVVLCESECVCVFVCVRVRVRGEKNT